jgi:hypothetical protein
MDSKSAGTAQGLRRGHTGGSLTAVLALMESGPLAAVVQRGAQYTMASPPTPNIRLTISVTPEVHATFQRLAAVTSSSLSKAMGDWLEDTMEGAQLMATKMEQFRAAPKQVMQEMHAMSLGLADEAASIVERMREKGRADRAGLARDARAGRVEPLPPSSNTGGKPTEKRHRGTGGIANRTQR